MRAPIGTTFETGSRPTKVQSTARLRTGARRAESMPIASTAHHVTVASADSIPNRCVKGICAA